MASYSNTKEPTMRSADGHVTSLLIGLMATDNAAQQRAVVIVRRALAPLRSELVRLDPASPARRHRDPRSGFRCERLERHRRQ